MYQDERKLDFKPLGIAIKKAREEKELIVMEATAQGLKKARETAE